MKRPIRVSVNATVYESAVEPRQSLADFLREDLDLTGTHLGCEHGVCGACTVLLDGEPIRSCLMLAVQADGRSVTTIEGLAPPSSEAAAEPGPPPLHPIQEAFWASHGLQCGYCTPGIILTTWAFLREHPDPTVEEIREMLAGNLCRCTGYHFIVQAVETAARALRSSSACKS
jgi:aerobic carbon-monoxide dehydrogenase small subunit